jgi:NTP pyrophosphatase (non-canonical NTP hydrolase)
VRRRDYSPTESDIPMHGWKPYSDVHRERIRAHEKHKDKPGGSMEQHDFDDADWFPVLTEEVGEVAKVINDHRHGVIDDASRIAELRGELVQVAAMAIAWIDSIDLTICGRTRPDFSGGVEECRLPPYHGGQHVSWSGIVRWGS